MPKFFVSFQSTNGFSQDDEGQDLPGLEAARTLAIDSVRELLSDNIKAGSRENLIAVVVTDDKGQEVARISAKDILPQSLK